MISRHKKGEAGFKWGRFIVYEGEREESDKKVFDRRAKPYLGGYILRTEVRMGACPIS